MKQIFVLVSIIIFINGSSAQNFSGLLNRKLNKIDDVGSLIESQLGGLFGGGKPDGRIDSVIVTWDSEKILKVKIWYTDFLNAYFTVSVTAASRQKQTEIPVSYSSQTTKPSPAEYTLEMAPDVPKGAEFSSAYLRIDISKKDKGSGRVAVFALNKNWRNRLDPQNVIIKAALQPVGKAAMLNNVPKDVTPVKDVKFNPYKIYTPGKATRLGGGNSVGERSFVTRKISTDISGTWTNSDVNTNGITKLIITSNSTIQGFGRCSPEDCDWGKVTLTVKGPDNFSALFSWNFKTTYLEIVHAAGQLSVTATDTYKDGRTRTTSYTFSKNLPVFFVAKEKINLNQLTLMKQPGVVFSKTPKGPDKNVQIYLLDGLSADVDFARPQDISNININVFADKNINSGIYYILPADYHLRWDTKAEPEKGYEFRILYGSQMETAGATTAPVRMSATLTADISSRERNFVKELLKAVRPDFTDLRYLPLRENPQFTFQSTLMSQYNIPQDKIAVETSTDLNNDIKVSWQTDADTKEFIQTSLTAREGVSASVILKPDDEEIMDHQIPAIINLADTRTFGKMSLEPSLWRGKNWRNTTPYPLRIKYFHVLKKQIGGTKPIIYSWSMNDLIVPSQAQVEFDHSRIPAWLDTDVSSVMWLEYSVEDCSECDKKVMDAVTGGVAGGKAQQVKFTIPPAVFDTLKASYFLVAVRSLQVDPKGTELKELPAVKIMNDPAKEFSVGPLYIPSGGTIDYEYKITVATTDGDFYPAAGWTKSNDKELLLGKTKLKEMFRGIIPGLN